MSTATTSTITLKGRSGASYVFELYEWGTSFRPVAGVYAVLRRDTDGFAVIYVGQTGDLSERFDDHHKAWCFDRERKTHIGVRLDSSEQSRLATEADLVANYRLPCNG